MLENRCSNIAEQLFMIFLAMFIKTWKQVENALKEVKILAK